MILGNRLGIYSTLKSIEVDVIQSENDPQIPHYLWLSKSLWQVHQQCPVMYNVTVHYIDVSIKLSLKVGS